MRIMCLAKGYASYGASILTSAAQHLELTLQDVEPTNLAIEVTAYIPHFGPPRPTLESLLERHILKFPIDVRVRHRAKAGKLDIDYPSALREEESFAKSGGIYAVAHVLPKALDELSLAIVKGLRSKTAIWNTVDHSQLAVALQNCKALLPSSSSEILDYMRTMDGARRASHKAPQSVDDLDIEWGHYHSSAKTVLDAPFFWSESDDDAPHGNDTGSDVLAAFKRWQKRNPASSYMHYVDRLLSRWGLTKEKSSGQIDEQQLLWTRQEADIALAFGAIKLLGKCEEPETQAAIAALENRLERLGDDPERVQKLILLRNKLLGQLTV